MKKAVSSQTKNFPMILPAFVLILLLAGGVTAQKKTPPADASGDGPKVTQVDADGLKNLIKPNGKPLLINFWATWCVPCREEFPDLVKIDSEYKGKIDFITVTVDFPEEINAAVPKFLREMKAAMPTYLLATNNEDVVISSVAKDWAGGMPFTILYHPSGATAYFKEGKIKPDVLRAEIEKALALKPNVSQTADLELSRPQLRSKAEGLEEARRDIAAGVFKIKRYGLAPSISDESIKYYKSRYGLEIEENGCLLVYGTADYFKAYNETMKNELEKRFGASFRQNLPF